jgi:glucokinase
MIIMDKPYYLPQFTPRFDNFETVKQRQYHTFTEFCRQYIAEYKDKGCNDSTITDKGKLLNYKFHITNSRWREKISIRDERFKKAVYII